jgi:hypothetical protein
MKIKLKENKMQNETVVVEQDVTVAEAPKARRGRKPNPDKVAKVAAVKEAKIHEGPFVMPETNFDTINLIGSTFPNEIKTEDGARIHSSLIPLRKYAVQKEVARIAAIEDAEAREKEASDILPALYSYLLNFGEDEDRGRHFIWSNLKAKAELSLLPKSKREWNKISLRVYSNEFGKEFVGNKTEA